MFDVKKLAKLLKEIFTRDNLNFSPELVAEELQRRSPEFFDYFSMDNACAMTDTSGDNNIASVGSSCYGGPYVWPNEVEIKVVTFSEVEKELGGAQQEPSLNEREQFHSEAVAWLAETYHKWPAGDNSGCRDWVLVNKDSEAGWFMPFAITLASGCVVYRSEWANFVNKIRPAKKSVIIGNGCTSNHKYAVVIGSNISSDKDYQLKIGSNSIQCSRDISQDEFDEIRKVFATLIGK